MNCPKCDSPLRVGRTYTTFKNDDTPELVTEGYTNIELLCINKKCDLYSGKDLSNPKQIVKTIANKL